MLSCCDIARGRIAGSVSRHQRLGAMKLPEGANPYSHQFNPVPVFSGNLRSGFTSLSWKGSSASAALTAVLVR